MILCPGEPAKPPAYPGGEMALKKFEGLPREVIALRVSQEIEDNSYVNLGIGIPTLVSNWLEGRDVILQSEIGMLKTGSLAEGGDIDQDKQVTTTDYTQWYNSARLGDSGYRVTDIDMDGQVTTSDYTVWYNNARLGASSQVP